MVVCSKTCAMLVAAGKASNIRASHGNNSLCKNSTAKNYGLAAVSEKAWGK